MVCLHVVLFVWISSFAVNLLDAEGIYRRHCSHSHYVSCFCWVLTSHVSVLFVVSSKEFRRNMSEVF